MGAGGIVNRVLKPMGVELHRAGAFSGPGAFHRPPPFNQFRIERLLYLRRVLDRAADVDGTVVECGIGRGWSFLSFAFLLHSEGARRKLWGFDSFEGFPEPSGEDESPRQSVAGDVFIGGGVQALVDMMIGAGLDAEFVRTQLTVVAGFFEESLVKYRGGPIAVLHLDVDLYASYKTCLEQLYDQVAPSGVVMFDEYLGTLEHVAFPGAQKAIDEFLGSRVSLLQRDAQTGKYFLVKPA